MGGQADELYAIVREVLEGRASEVLLGRMKTLLAEREGDAEALREGCTRLEKMANLFLGADEARRLGEGFSEWWGRQP